MKCRHRNANPIHPLMADLPRERLDEHVFPFTIPESTTSDPSKSSSYDVAWRDGAASSHAWQRDQYTSKSHSHWTPSRAQEVSTNDNSAVLCLRETEVGWADCRSARVERSLPTSEEFAKPELKPKRSSSNPWTRLLRHPSPIRFQQVRGQNCSMGPTSEASSNSCYNSKLSIRGQVSKSAE